MSTPREAATLAGMDEDLADLYSKAIAEHAARRLPRVPTGLCNICKTARVPLWVHACEVCE